MREGKRWLIRTTAPPGALRDPRHSVFISAVAFVAVDAGRFTELVMDVVDATCCCFSVFMSGVAWRSYERNTVRSPPSFIGGSHLSSGLHPVGNGIVARGRVTRRGGELLLTVQCGAGRERGIIFDGWLGIAADRGIYSDRRASLSFVHLLQVLIDDVQLLGQRFDRLHAQRRDVDRCGWIDLTPLRS